MKPIPNYQIEGLFPTPLYIANRDSDLDSTEKKEIEDIIKEGMYLDSNMTTHNTYIFNNKLKKLKQFCEMHIDNYVKQLLNQEEETNYYITQSWLSTTKPGEYHHRHSHINSLISGTFYISTAEGDMITCIDPNTPNKTSHLHGEKDHTKINIWNALEWSLPVNNNKLLLFPSYMSHYVPINESTRSEPRMTIAFNTFAKGIFGNAKFRTELILS